MTGTSNEGAKTKLAAAQALLAGEVERLVSGEDWQRYLALQARLHSYSFGNVLLIDAQHRAAFAAGTVTAPQASVVAGFRAWQAMGRSVTRGQHGYSILAPCRVRLRAETEREDVETGAVRGGAPTAGRRLLTGFRVAHVFDVSQTSGADLPLAPAPQLLVGSAPAGLENSVCGLLKTEGFSVGSVRDAIAIGGANGLTDWSTRQVLVRSDMAEMARVKTLLHETGHALLHGDLSGRALPRTIKEVEAESVAFIVAAAHGMDTSGYSFPYVVGWAGANAGKAISLTGARVSAAARRVIDATSDVSGPAAAPTAHLTRTAGTAAQHVDGSTEVGVGL